MARKILLADDSVTAQNMGRKILADAGYEVITVNNGSAALKKIGEQHPDLIVLDVYMPGYSGLEVCQRLKETGDTSRIPILLTVGKLEPFKPEEARRVRADGFIVKPFEASELLSALSKLEDRIVPRSESSKPGRFARATAAIDEPRYDRSVANEEDSGWKSRIVFPKKKEKPPEPEVEDPAIYNPVNKDLKTVIEHKIEEAPVQPPAHQPEPQKEERVHLGALGTEGLPKDVTPEEIAALAAAAAQVKGTIEEAKAEETAAVPETPVMVPEATAASPESKTDQKKEEETPVAEPVASAVESAPVPEPAVTLAAQPKSEKSEKEAEPELSATPTEVMAAIAGLEQSSASDSLASSPASGNGSGVAAGKSDEPVTMAVAAAVSASGPSPRWAAVAVALAPEESTISLEQEMQRAQAAVAPVETTTLETPAVAPEPNPVPEPVAEPAPEAAAIAELSSSLPEVASVTAEVPATPAPESTSSFAEVASAAKEAVTAAISELASVAASYLAPEPTPSAEAAAPVPVVPVPQHPVFDSAAASETKSDVSFIAEAPKFQEEKLEAKPEEAEIKPAEIEAKFADTEAKPVEAIAELTEEKPVEEQKEVPEPVAETAAPKDVEVSEVQESTREAVPTAVTPESVDYTAGGMDGMAKKESEMTATTAAAWANWRKIRESGGPKLGQSLDSAKEMNEPEDSAAMAVAAGAEGKPEDVNTNLDSDPEIASIVDSVLADMRPKIVEEIARKLGKKK
ncbi:MAG TPA: response regulator [Candidatus Sulfotelmatobacter sp.]|nr:response regulator [Candidatus Sulfotelmatobacter sp.]